MYNLLFCNNDGELMEDDHYSPVASSGNDSVIPDEKDFIPLPPESMVMMLPRRIPLARNKRNKITEISKVEGEEVFPVSVILPPGYTRLFYPAYKKRKNAPHLPFFAYTCVGSRDNQMFCTARLTHEDIRWDPGQYNSLDLEGKIKRKLKKYPKNRLLQHLSHCAEVYRCFTAQNIFYDRWEGGIPVSSACSANCVGCISESHLKGTPSPQERISFVPTVEEIVEIAVPHLETPGGIISFGQGCEGEPLTRGDLIRDAIIEIRKKTDRGTIHINTNAGLPHRLEPLFDAGMDSVRISINSAIKERYLKYFNPSYSYEDFIKSIEISLKKAKYTYLNWLLLPGVNDREEEVEAFLDFLRKYPINMIQIRNLNIDPDYYFQRMEKPAGKSLGVSDLIDLIQKEFPAIKIGNFSIPLTDGENK